jgi:putative chitinase
MQITEEQILKAVPHTNRKRLAEFVVTFNKWGDKFGINTPLRVTHFLAQCWHESGALSAVEENMNYSAKRLLVVFPKYFDVTRAQRYAGKPQMIANRVYANRMGNGNEDSGDGWRFRGRGIIGTTGRANYKEYADSEFCVGDLMSHPEWLAQSPGAYKSAMFFWWKNNCNKWADADDVDGLTKRINGGFNGLSDRKRYLQLFRQVFLK